MLKENLIFRGNRKQSDKFLNEAAIIFRRRKYKGEPPFSPPDEAIFLNGVSKAMMFFIESSAIEVARRGSIRAIDRDDYMQNMYLMLMEKLYKFNEHADIIGRRYSFATFMRIYELDCLRLTLLQSDGILEQLRRESNLIVKMKKAASLEYGIRIEDVPVYLVKEMLRKRNLPHLSTSRIKTGEITYDDYKGAVLYGLNVNPLDIAVCDTYDATDAYITSDFKAFLDSLSPLYQFLLIQGMGLSNLKIKTTLDKKLACDKRFISLCKQDPYAKKHIRHGDVYIKLTGECFLDVDFLDEGFLSDKRYYIKKRLARFCIQNGYNEEDILANLMPLLYEIESQMKLTYGL